MSVRHLIEADLAADTGFTLIKHKRSGANTYARTAAQYAAVGGADDWNLMNWVDPDFDDDLIAGVITSDLQTYFDNALTQVGALASNKRLIIPAFTFRFSTLVTMDVDGLTLDGSGATFLLGGTHPRGMQIEQGCRFNGLTLKRADLVDTEHLVYFTNTPDGVLFFRCSIDGNMRGQTATLPYYTEFTCRGVYAAHPKNLWWEICEFTDGGNRVFDMRAAGISGIRRGIFRSCGVNIPTGNPGTCIEFTTNDTGGLVGESYGIILDGIYGERWGDGLINSRYVTDHTISNIIALGHGYFGEAAMGIEENAITLLGGKNSTLTNIVAKKIKGPGVMLRTDVNASSDPLDLEQISVTNVVLEDGTDPFNVGGTASLDTSFQVRNASPLATAKNISISGGAIRRTRAGGTGLSISVNATSGIEGLDLTGITFYGPYTGVADGSKAIALPDSNIANLVGLRSGGHTINNFEIGYSQSSGVPTDAVIGPDTFNNVLTQLAGTTRPALWIGTSHLGFSSTASTIGRIRLANADSIQARNAANNANLGMISTNSSDEVLFAGGLLAALASTPRVTVAATTRWCLGVGSIQSIASGGTIAAAPIARVVGSGGAVTTAAAAIAAGTSGQIIRILGTDDTNTVTLNGSAQVKLGAASRTLGANDVLTLIYYSTASAWIESAFTATL